MEKLTVDRNRAFSDPIYFHKKFTKMKFSPGQENVLRALWKHHRVLVKAGRRFGKTVTGAGATEAFAWTRGGMKVGYFAPSWDQCEIFMEEIYKNTDGTLLEGSFEEKKKFSFLLSNKTKVVAKTANISSQSGRGHGFDFIIPDESAFIPDEVMAAIRPTRLVGNSWELQMSNPCGHNHFYRDFNSDVFKTFSFKSIDNPLVSKEQLALEKEIMPSLQYKQEYEGEFIDDEFSIFPNKIIEEASQLGLSRGVKFLNRGIEGHNYYCGIDLGRRHDKSIIVVVDHVHPYLDLVYRKEIINDYTDKYWVKVLDEIEFACKLFKIKVGHMDQTSIGDMPTLTLRQTFAEKNIPSIINGRIFSSAMKNSRDGLVNSLLLQFERNYLALPHYPELIKQLKNVRRTVVIRPTRDVTATYSLTGLDHVTALALAVEATPFFGPSFFHVKANIRKSSLEDSGSRIMKMY